MESTNDVATTIAAFQTSLTADLTTVGLALIALAAVAIGFKWVKGALFS